MTFRNFKKLTLLSLAVSLFASVSPLRAQDQGSPLVVTATNAASNQLLVYDTKGKLLQTLSTQGKGGAGGNSGGIEARGNIVAVVNFGSDSVAIFERGAAGLHLTQMVPTAAGPLSVAFGADYLYILGKATVESHRMDGNNVSAGGDGVVSLIKSDGSAAQVGVLPNELIITEKSNAIETVELLPGGSVTGVATLVMNIPSNVSAPFGLVTRGNDAYVSIAAADEISLARKGDVLATTPTAAQHAPCWVALAGPFLYSTNTASRSISRFAVYGQKIVSDAPVAAVMNGGPIDVAAADGLLAVIDVAGSLSHISIFMVDEDGNLTLRVANTINSHANGIAFVGEAD